MNKISNTILDDYEIIEHFGIKYCFSKTSKGSSEKSIANSGRWENRQSESWKGVVEKDMIVVDGGSQTGYYAFLAAKKMENTGIVYAFEPYYKHFTRLMIATFINGFKNVIPLCLGLSDLQHSTPPGRTYPPWSKYRVIALDEIIKDRLDLIKLDIQGAERYAIPGMINLLRNNPQMKLFISWHSGAKGVCTKILNKEGFTNIGPYWEKK